MTQTLERIIGTVRAMFAAGGPGAPELDRGLDLLEAPRRWLRLFAGNPPWADARSLGLPAAIAAEVARLTTVELAGHIAGGARAAFLDEQLQPVLAALRGQCEFAAACGGIMMKPYVAGRRVAVDFVLPGGFIPTQWDGQGRITGAVFLERFSQGGADYTRLEHHRLTDEGYVVENRAFCAGKGGGLGRETPLAAVPRWAALSPRVCLAAEDAPAGPLFSYFKLPFANAAQPGSPLGVAVYGRAESLLEEADRQYERLLWEYEGSELAVDASVGALDVQNGEARLPRAKRRLFRELAVTGADGGDLYRVFSPAIRDESLLRGLDSLLKRIEFACCLSYGTLSDPQAVAKTAEEIKMSKQRSYSAVCDIQKSLEGALRDLVRAMDAYATLYGLAPEGGYEAAFHFGDGVAVDTDTERAQMRLDCQAGAAAWWEYRAKFYGESEEEARLRADEARKGDGA